MSIRVTGRNFQSWVEFDLAIDGLTVVHGDSNLGKSALFRVVKAVLRNELAAGHIRVGQDSAEIAIEIDGRSIEVSRTRKGSAKYRVDGETYAKLGGTLPEPVEALRMGEIRIGDVALDPIFARQGAEQFLVEMKPAALNAVLGAFSSTEKLEAGKRTANQRIADLNVQARLVAAETRAAEEAKARLEALEERASVVSEKIDRLGPEARRMGDLVREAATQAARIGRRDRISAVVARVRVPSTEEAARAVELASVLGRAARASARRAEIAALLARVAVPEMGRALASAEIVLAAQKAAKARRSALANRRAMEAVGGAVERWTGIVGLVKRSRALDAHAGTLAARARSLAASGKMEALVRRAESASAEARSLAAKAEAAAALASALRARASASSALAGIDARIAELGGGAEGSGLVRCPECGAEFEAGALAAARETPRPEASARIV